jgi:YspA, cpYpsA-related SLOG family
VVLLRSCNGTTFARLSDLTYRVLILGGPDFCEYSRLRDALDLALVNRLPKVEIITMGGPGVPALAASYARSRRLSCVVMLPDYITHPGDAIEKRDALLIAEADAIIVAGDELGLASHEWMQRAKRKGIPVMPVGSDWRTPVEPAVMPRPHGFPD